MKYYESKAYGRVCEAVFGIDLKQRGMMTMPELEILLSHSDFNESQNILEIGSGAGQIAAYISKKTSAKFIGIDIDEDVVAWASISCKVYKNVSFRVLDVRNVSEINKTFTKILAIDSLYFLSDMKFEGFFETLKSTIKNLHALLDDGGELVVFWSELPFFVPERKEPECTQMGICLKELGLAYRSIDLTDYEIAFWKKNKSALLAHKKDFINEGSEKLYSESINEVDFFLEYIKRGCLYRNLYLV